jgi:hypothetical protein
MSPPLPLGGKACPHPNPHDADKDARESLRRQRFLDKDDDSSKKLTQPMLETKASTDLRMILDYTTS